jgi:hypothetical protein
MKPRQVEAMVGPPRLAPFHMPAEPDTLTGDMVDPIKAALR